MLTLMESKIHKNEQPSPPTLAKSETVQKL